MTIRASAAWQNADLARLARVAIMPDEYFATYAGRVANVHGAASIGDLFLGVTGEHSRESWLEYIPLLAHAAALDADVFVALHTNYWLNTLFAQDSPNYDLPVSQWNPRSFRYLIAPGRFLRCCADCMSEDQQFWGLSYWRNSHQLPGVDWCPKHRTRLLVSDLHTHSTSYLGPNEVERESLSDRSNLLPRPRKISSRYLEVLFGLLDARGKFTRRQLVGYLNARAETKQIECATKGGRKALVPYIKLKSPLEFGWVQDLLLDPSRPPRFQLETKFHNMFKQGVTLASVETYALAMAALWERPDEALAGLLNYRACESETRG